MVSRLSGGQKIVGSTPITLTEASSNGRASVLHTDDGGSIPLCFDNVSHNAIVCLWKKQLGCLPSEASSILVDGATLV
jgi:hypothetical protein